MHYLLLFATTAALVWMLADKLWQRTRHLALRPALGPHALNPGQEQRLQRLGIIELRVFGGGAPVGGRLLHETRTTEGNFDGLFHARGSTCQGGALIRRTAAGYELRLARALHAAPPEEVCAYVDGMLRSAALGVAAQRRRPPAASSRAPA
jgi:hypothetical protein